MILSDDEIREALQAGDLRIEPPPPDAHFSPTALDLRIGEDIRNFNPSLYNTPGFSVSIELDAVTIPALEPHMCTAAKEVDGSIIIRPGQLIIATTLEWIELPPQGRLAARVEGRSSFARLGLVVHMTAPTIHNTFRGRITLEIMNHGPISLRVRPNASRICQLIFERVGREPTRPLASPFQDQSSPLGGRKPN